MACRSLAQPVAMKRRRAAPETTPHGHAISGSQMIVARRTEDVVAVSATIENFAGDRKWESRSEFTLQPAGIQMFVVIQKSTCHDTCRQRARGSMVGEERTLAERSVS